MRNKQFILWFDELGIKDVPLVGGKNASLGEMYRSLHKKGVKVPNGFAVTAYAYQYLLIKSRIKNKIKKIVNSIDVKNVKELTEKAKEIRKIIFNAKFPDELTEAINKAYKKLCKKQLDVAVRSSATAEDLPTASFAGQQETYLNISGEKNLINACKKCFASLFTARAISYRVENKFDHMKVYLSIGVQKMVRSTSSGVMFTIDTESGFKDVVFINASHGLGENIVQGAVNPDEYYVFKKTIKKYRPIIRKNIGSKRIKMVYTKTGTKNISTSEKERNNFVLSDDEILKLAKWGIIIEEHYKKPMDMEWAKDKELFIVQARPETVQSQKNMNVLEDYEMKKRGKILCTGKSVGAKVGQGIAHIIKSMKKLKEFKKGEVLITKMTNPDMEPIMKIASAIVTDKGGRTCHAAIISRELGIPCVVGTNNATKKIKNGMKVTVSCSEGEEGFIYKGILPFKIDKVNVKRFKRPKTKVMMNVGNPDRAFEFSFIPNDGVGLAREEFIINEFIKIHPKALIYFDKLDRNIKKQIEKLTYGYKSKIDFYVSKLAQGIAMIGAAFYPKPVIVRFSDFKTNEYANLIGGKEFEPKEDNPMIGWRGASRYYSDFKDAFALECKAIKKVREEFGLKNVIVMIPFCRTIEEGEKVLLEMKKNKLEKGKDNLEVYVMCEIPSNVILADDFAKIFDGFSIGSNDLTQLTLGLDRDSEIIAHIFDERNDAVKKMMGLVIMRAHKHGRKVGICGESVSNYPEIARFLVHCGIDSVSLSPDAVVKTSLAILKEEKKLRK